MAKIQLTYKVPDGEFCMKAFEDKCLIPTCKYLFRDNWCTLCGAGPAVIFDGHAVMRRKLYACVHSEVIETPTEVTPSVVPAGDSALPREEA